ncbi:unnamed protein product (macronuclear) [Paramecium tetraurelia]|uniref:Uncharacterized protein n=1 Tax=Paramecium tetraurelia TaxID=5888 RepID=A0D625_PARTE|nr:uncharacterized protein GSPATT00013922001 [Paramecium tetraurelia]CAK78492.1 unnamed protein product [Paramecium tetraurelia]|eukprot:XP_001445889.1 hypothetical protein (macronuclear) [Paramecium tetraurelia strain d4-2]
MQHSIQEIQAMSLLTLYRMLIKNVQYYPSKNRFKIMLAIKESYSINFYKHFLRFRDNRLLNDTKRITQEIKIAQMGLRNLEMYRIKNKEMKDVYKVKDDGFQDSMNPKDKNFIYF